MERVRWALDALRKTIPLRQIETAELLVNANINYASAILAETPQAELVTPQMPKRLKGMGRSHCPSGARAFTIARSDIANPQFVRQDLLHLTVVKEYLRMLIINDGVARPESIGARQHLSSGARE